MNFFTDYNCNTYFALVSPTWDPNGPHVHNARQTLNMKCYSSWYFPMDITRRIINAIASSINTGHGPMLAVNGFYGFQNNNLYHSVFEEKAWVQYEFDDVVTVTKVIVRARTYPPWPKAEFDKVKIKLGNTSQPSGVISSFSLLGKYESYSGNGAIIVFQAIPPIAGKYLTLKRYENSEHYLIIGDLKVIGY